MQKDKTWIYHYSDSTITVKNKNNELYINGELRDALEGQYLKTFLTCKLDTGETVKAIIQSGMTDADCLLTVNNLIIEPTEIK